MTMADTVAVMNAGRIEQLGAPGRALRAPATDVRRELPRPVQPARRPRSGRGTATDARASTCGGQALAVPADAPAGRGRATVLVGVRPEKIRCSRADGEPPPTGREPARPGGVVADASFTGVCTQYLVRLPWGQELVASSPRTSALGERVRRPAPRSPGLGRRRTRSPSSATPSAADGGPSTAGPDARRRRATPRASWRAEGAGVAIATVARTELGGDPGQDPAPAAVRRRRLTPYLLLLPGLAWLALFFVVPIVTLLGTSLQTPVAERRDRRLRPDLPLRELHRRAPRVLRRSSAARSSTRASPPCSACSSATRWPT